MDNLKELITACNQASYHWADDTCREWPKAQAWQTQAYAIWDRMTAEERALVEPQHWGLVRRPPEAPSPSGRAPVPKDAQGGNHEPT